jgi:hypothetical protein
LFILIVFLHDIIRVPKGLKAIAPLQRSVMLIAIAKAGKPVVASRLGGYGTGIATEREPYRNPVERSSVL